ncbi:MAG: MBL fold metallo-hydrolase [Candidatus Heimdallarchaeota archaeon]
MVKEIASDLYSVSGKGIYSVPIFVVEKKNGMLTLIDTGLEKDISVIIKKIRKRWDSLEKIERIVFTHRHLDHTGGLPTLIYELTTISAPESPLERIEIICHKDEAKYFIEEQEIDPIKPNKLVEHNEIIDQELQLRAVHVPGHTYGHICILAEKQKLLFLGDTIMHMFFRLQPVFKRFHDDYDLYLKTLNKILDFEWDYAIPSHMKPVNIPRDRIKLF